MTEQLEDKMNIGLESKESAQQKQETLDAILQEAKFYSSPNSEYLYLLKNKMQYVAPDPDLSDQDLADPNSNSNDAIKAFINSSDQIQKYFLHNTTVSQIDIKPLETILQAQELIYKDNLNIINKEKENFDLEKYVFISKNISAGVEKLLAEWGIPNGKTEQQQREYALSLILDSLYAFSKGDKEFTDFIKGNNMFQGQNLEFFKNLLNKNIGGSGLRITTTPGTLSSAYMKVIREKEKKAKNDQNIEEEAQKETKKVNIKREDVQNFLTMISEIPEKPGMEQSNRQNDLFQQKRYTYYKYRLSQGLDINEKKQKALYYQNQIDFINKSLEFLKGENKTQVNKSSNHNIVENTLPQEILIQNPKAELFDLPDWLLQSESADDQDNAHSYIAPWTIQHNDPNNSDTNNSTTQTIEAPKPYNWRDYTGEEINPENNTLNLQDTKGLLNYVKPEEQLISPAYAPWLTQEPIWALENDNSQETQYDNDGVDNIVDGKPHRASPPLKPTRTWNPLTWFK